jgi:hypothetical protein
MAGAAVQEIVLAPLSVDDMDQLVTDSLRCEPHRARPVAQLIHEKTGGNPFFAIQFLLALAEEELLAFNPRAGMWTWDLSGIQAKRYSGDVVELVTEKLKRLSQTTQQALKKLACLGNSAKISTLNLVYHRGVDPSRTLECCASGVRFSAWMAPTHFFMIAFKRRPIPLSLKASGLPSGLSVWQACHRPSRETRTRPF